MESWWIDEILHAGPEHLDPEYISRYERKAGFDPSADIQLLIAEGLNSDSAIIDFGAATGVFALAVAPLCRRVIAVDPSPAMNWVLRRKVKQSGVLNVEVVESGLLSYEHSGDPVDFIYSRNTFHQLPDFWKAIALDRIVSIAKPGAKFRLRDLVFDFEPRCAGQAIEAWMAGAVEDPMAGFTAAELADHVRLEHSTFNWIFEAMLERSGFKILDKSYRRGAYGDYLCRLIAAPPV